MRLPDRLDYYEDSYEIDGVEEFFPHVICPHGDWDYKAAWYDLADDGSVDWDKEHPAHAGDPIREREGQLA